MKSILCVLLFALVQESDTKKKEAEEREAKAQALYDQGVQAMDGAKYRDAQTKFREVRDRYRMTEVYFKNAEDIADRLLDCGSKIAVEALKTQAIHKKTLQDSWHGIEYAPPDGWRGIPPSAKYSWDTDTSEVKYQGQFIRIGRYTSPYLENLYLQAYKLYAPKDLADLEARTTEDFSERYKGFAEDGASALKGRFHAATRKTYKDSDGGRYVAYYFLAEKKGYVLVGYWRTRAEFFSDKKREVADDDWKAALRVFDDCAKTFWIWPQQQASAMKIKLNKGVSLPDWKVHRTKNYVIEYATRDDFAKKVGEQMEMIMALYRATLPTSKAIPVCRVKLFDNEEDFQYYGQAAGAAAYWSPGQQEIVAYRFSGKELKLDSDEKLTLTEGKDPEEETFHVMYHEGFHQYMHYFMGSERDIYVPSWINEGMGDYFFGGTWTKKGGKLALEIQTNWWRLETIQEAIKEGKHVPIDKIIRYKQSNYYADAGLCYAEGWSICYFFLTSPVAKKKGYGSIILKLMDELRKSEDWEKATTAAFAGVDFKQLEAEWKEYTLGLKPVTKR